MPVVNTWQLWDEPFFTGVSQLGDVGPVFQVAIGGHGYVVDPAQCKREFLTQLRPSFTDASTQPGEHSLNPESSWPRSTDSYELGAGQTYFDDESSSTDPGSSRERFRVSKGVNPWVKRQLTLLPATHVTKASALGASTIQAVSGADTTRGVFVLDDDGSNHNVYRSVNPTASSPTWTGCTGLPAGKKLWWIATDGANVYVVAGDAGSTKIYSTAMTGTAFTALTGTADSYVGCAYANGRLFAWLSTGEIAEVVAAGTKTTLMTHRLTTGFGWTGVVAAPNAAYLLGNSGQSAEIYRTDVADATGALAKPILAGSVDGEAVLCGAFAGGALALGFGKNGGLDGNVRVAQIGASGALTMGAGTVVGDTPEPVYAMSVGGQYGYFGWSNYDGTSSGQGRLDLTATTDPGGTVFAYASDLMMAGQGAVRSTLGWQSARLFTVDGVGLVCQDSPSSTVPVTGTLSTGRVRFGMLDYKTFANLDAHWDPLPANCTVAFTAAFEDGSSVAVFSSDADGSIGPGGKVNLPAGRHEWCELTVTLTGTSGTTVTTPTLRWWRLRAIPVAGSAERIIVAILLRHWVRNRASDVDAVDLEYLVQAEQEFLRDLCRAKTVVSYQTGGSSEDVYVNNCSEEPEAWSWDQDVLEGMYFVELRTLG